MTVYQAKSNKLVFDITKDYTLIGQLTYKSWFKFNATITLPNTTEYEVLPKGFWGTTIEVKDGENVLLEFKMNWSGDVVIQTYFNAVEKGYVFKHRGFFKDSFILLDEDGAELLVMKPHVKWSKMFYEYEITTADAFEALSNKEIVLITSLHCANYYMSMVTASIGG